MDDYAEMLASEQTNQNALLMEILTIDYSGFDYIIVVEGDTDIPFYYDFVHSAIREKTAYFHSCRCKSAVLRLKTAIETYNWQEAPRFRYLCDKDFDDYNNTLADGVWYTSWYSIESYISCTSFVEYILQKYATPPLKTTDRRDFLNTYDFIFCDALKSLRPFAALMCELKADGQNPDFDEFGIERLFDLRGGTLHPRRRKMAAALEAISAEYTLNFSRLLKRSRSLNIADWQLWLRGKLALQLCRKAYGLAIQRSRLRSSLPRQDLFGTNSLPEAYNFWRELPSLSDYIRTG